MIYRWRVHFFHAKPVDLDASDLSQALEKIQEEHAIDEIKAISCLSAAGTTRAIFRQKVSLISNYSHEAYRQTEQLVFFIRGKYPTATEKKMARLLGCLKEVNSLISDLYNDLPSG